MKNIENMFVNMMNEYDGGESQSSAIFLKTQMLQMTTLQRLIDLTSILSYLVIVMSLVWVL